MDTSRYLFHRIFSLNIPEDKGSVEQGYLNLIALTMNIDGKVQAEEVTDATHLVEQFVSFAEYEGRTELREAISEALVHVQHMGADQTIELACEQIVSVEERETALKMVAYIADSDQRVSPVESALLGWVSEAFGIEGEHLTRVLDELDAEVSRQRVELDASGARVPEEPNPFLDYQHLPRFREVEPEQLGPAVKSLLPELQRQFEAIEASDDVSWGGLVVPLTLLNERLSFTWGLAGHLLNVANSDALRAAYEAVQAELVAFSVQTGQSRAIFEKLSELHEDASLDEPQQRIINSLILQARHSGVGLDGSQRERFNAIQTELAQLSTQFSNNLLDATKAWEMVLTTPEEVAGLQPSALRQAAQSARSAGHEDATGETGPWRFTLDVPSLFPFLRHASRRDLREKIYRAYLTRASDGEQDNTPIIEHILGLRREEASLLGYSSFAELSLSAKMADSVGAVEELAEELRLASWQHAQDELEELKDFAASKGAEEADDLKQWDVSFWAERLREERYEYSDEEVRPYFPFPKVCQGLFELVEKLFGVKIEEANGDAVTWHEDVSFYHIKDGEEHIASFFLDPYTRPGEKRGGAWHGSCKSRSVELAGEAASVQIPVSYLVCNQTPPVDDAPSLMTFREVSTLFHEFGHGLQHMLTTIDHAMAAGTRNVEWDAVELPSQFMENWCYHPDILRSLTSHYATGEALPDEYIDKILAARHFRAGSAMLRQLYFGLMDIKLHSAYIPGQDESIFDIQREVASNTSALALLDEDRFLCSFAHIFAGGYAAGYYSYKWAEVLSADAFSAFEEVGLDNDEAVAETGARFRETVLAMGGGRDPMEVFKDFRGRPPETTALLRHAGLA